MQAASVYPGLSLRGLTVRKVAMLLGVSGSKLWAYAVVHRLTSPIQASSRMLSSSYTAIKVPTVAHSRARRTSR